MMKTTFKLTTLLLILLAPAARAQTVTVSGNAAFDFKAGADKDMINIPLKIDKGKLSEVTFTDGHPYSIRNAAYSGAAYSDAVTVLPLNGAKSLTLELRPLMLDGQGSYDVNIEYTVGSDSKLLNFTLNRPAAVLEVPTVVITEDGWSPHADQVSLTETGNRAGASGITITDPYVPGIKEGKLIQLDGKARNVTASGSITIPYKLNDDLFSDLPLGEIKTKAVIRTNSLATPLQVQFDIWNKRSKWWIIAVVLGGLGLGFVVRHFLKDKLDYDQALLNAIDLIKDINTYTAGVADAGFKDDIKKLIVVLQQAMNNSGVFNQQAATKKINDAIDAAKSRYNSLKGAFEAKLATQRQTLEALVQTLVSPAIEKTVNDRLKAAQDILKDAEGVFKTSDFSGTQALMDKASAAAAIALDGFLRYADSFVIFFQAKSLYIPAVLTDALKDPVNTGISAIQATLNAIVRPVTDIKTGITTCNSIQVAMEGFESKLDDLAGRDFYQLNPKATTIPTFINAYKSWIIAMVNMVNNPGTVDKAIAYWQSDPKKQLDEAWTAANAVTKKTLLGGDDHSANYPKPANQSQGLFAKNDGAQPAFVFSDLQLADLNRTYQNIAADYWRYNIIQIVLMALLISLGVLVANAQSFVGTFAELTNLFFFSFSMDVTVTALAQFKGKSGA